MDAGLRGWKATSGTRKRKGTQRVGCSGGVYTRIEACIRSLEGCLASWTKIFYEEWMGWNRVRQHLFAFLSFLLEFCFVVGSLLEEERLIYLDFI